MAKDLRCKMRLEMEQKDILEQVKGHSFDYLTPDNGAGRLFRADASA